MAATSEICRLSVRRIAELYRSRELSPVEVVAAFLARIERLNPALNAFVTITAESAKHAARVAEARFNKRSGDLPLLAGIPFSVKDTLPTANVRTTFGSRLFADHVPTESGAAVDSVERAGGILLGKTNSPALGWIAVTHNKLFGPTPNPWDATVTCGGSSGGAAVSAIAALAPVNVGTDGGGSLRVPAAFSGAVGFKPSYGRVPNFPTGPNWGLQHIGPIARTVEDAVDALDTLARPDTRDPYCLPAPSVSFFDASKLAAPSPRILFCPDLGFAESVDPEVVSVCRDAVNRLSMAGFPITEKTLDWPSPMAAWQTLFVAGVANRLGPFVAERPYDIEDKILEFIAQARGMAPDDYYKAWLSKNEFWQSVRPTFEEYDLLITPTVACLPFALGKDTPGSVAGRDVSFYGWAPFSAPFNMTGQPAISVPAGRSKSGLPIGLQIVGRRLEDSLVLSVAAAYQEIHPWPTSVPGLD